jgi:hypothetical protein
MSDEEKHLRQLLQQIYDRQSSNITVSPGMLATAAMVDLDPFRHAPLRVASGCELHLRQIARQICRDRFAGDDGAPEEQHSLFPLLQKRYPAARSPKDDPVYILLEHLDDTDIEWNASRLEKESSAKALHARALRAYGQIKKAEAA